MDMTPDEQVIRKLPNYLFYPLPTLFLVVVIAVGESNISAFSILFFPTKGRVFSGYVNVGDLDIFTFFLLVIYHRKHTN